MSRRLSWTHLYVTVVLALILVVSSCQQQAPTPTVPPKVPTPAAAPTAAPAPAGPTVAAALVAPTAPATAAKSTGVAAAAKPSGKLVVALASFSYEQTLLQEGSVNNHAYWNPMYDFLFYRDRTGNLIPGLIEKWQIAPDKRSWTFQVRQGVKFHSGDDFTAEDVKYNIELLVDSKSVHIISPGLRAAVDRVELPNPQTVVVYTKDVAAGLPLLISEFNSVPIMSKKYIERVGMDQAREKPVGTGAFKFVSRNKGEYIKFEAVENHWRKTPAFSQFELRLVAEPSTRLAMLKRGEADIVELPLSFKKEAEAAKLRTFSLPGARNTLLLLAGQYKDDRPGFDPNLPYLKKEVRQALNLAINRQELVDHVYYGEGKPAADGGPLPSMPEFNPELKPYPFDPAKAKQLLAAAGYPSGFDTEIKAYPWPGVPDLQSQAEAVAQYWRAIGVNTKLTPTEYAVIRPIVVNRQKSGWAANHQWGPVDLITLYTVAFTDKGGPLWGTERMPIMRQMIESAAAETDVAKRTDILRAMDKIIYDEYLWVPVAHVNSLYGISDKVGAWPQLAHDGGANYFEYVERR